jgi:hypothetical protein
VAFVDRAVQIADAIGGAERVEQRPVVHVLDGVVRAVVRTPAREAAQVVARVEVLRVEDFAGLGVNAQQLALEQRPFRRRHGGRDVEHGATFGMRAPRQQRDRAGGGDESSTVEQAKSPEIPSPAPILLCVKLFA